MTPIDVLLLSQKDVISLELEPALVFQAVEAALREHAAGTFEMHPKIGVHPTGTDPANFIHAMPAYLRGLGACGLKWVGGFAKNPQRGLPNVTGVQVCNDPDTGVPLAIMDCSYLTGLRTAAVSAIAAQRCAVAKAGTLALVGCGFQGMMHARFLIEALPGLQHIRLRDVRDEAMQHVKEQVSQVFAGSIVICPDNAACIDGADVICTCTNGEEAVIQAEWFKPGAFGVGIEGGSAYTGQSLHQADKFVVDDIPLVQYFDEIGRDRRKEDGQPDPEFPGGLPAIYGTIGEIVSGLKPGRTSDTERIVAIPIGMAICDIALGDLILRVARERKVGHMFRLA